MVFTVHVKAWLVLRFRLWVCEFVCEMLWQNGSHFADNIFEGIFLNENVWIPIKISLKFVPKDLINNIPALVHIMAWWRIGNKPLSELMGLSLMTHICVTWPQWVNHQYAFSWYSFDYWSLLLSILYNFCCPYGFIEIADKISQNHPAYRILMINVYKSVGNLKLSLMD